MPNKSSSVKFELAEDVQKLIEMLVIELDLQHIKSDRIFCVRSNQSKARAYARIWGLSRIFQVAAGYKPTYVIEVLSEHFDELTDEKKLKVLIHELLHIPKTFSGALLPHNGRHHKVNDAAVHKLFQKLKLE